MRSVLIDAGQTRILTADTAVGKPSNAGTYVLLYYLGLTANRADPLTTSTHVRVDTTATIIRLGRPLSARSLSPMWYFMIALQTPPRCKDVHAVHQT